MKNPRTTFFTQLLREADLPLHAAHVVANKSDAPNVGTLMEITDDREVRLEIARCCIQAWAAFPVVKDKNGNVRDDCRLGWDDPEEMVTWVEQGRPTYWGYMKKAFFDAWSDVLRLA